MKNLSKPAMKSLLVLFLAVFWLASQAQAFAPAKGMFLVADEKMADPRFKDRVILLIQHDDQGSAGLIVNRSSRLPLAAVLPQTSQLAGRGKTLSYGGPVNPETLLALIKVHKNPPNPADEIMQDLYITGVGVLDNWQEFSGEVIDYRAFTGYSGWAAGQLEVEMQRGDWHLLPADEDSVFSGHDETLWKSLTDRDTNID